MNTITNHMMKRATLAIIISLGFLVIYAPPADAHKVEHRTRVTHDIYYAYDRAYAMPRWVRKDRGFRRWFLHSRYRSARWQDWHRLYDLYSYERQMHRHSHRYHRRGKKYRGYYAPAPRHAH